MKRQGIRYLTQEQKQVFLRTMKVRVDAVRSYAMYDLILNTGLRLDETVRLNVGDIQGHQRLEVIGKGSKIREIPLNKAILAHLEVFLQWKKKKGEPCLPESPLFVSRLGRRISKRAVQRDFIRWVRVAGIEGHFTPHALRHTVGTQLLNRSGNLRVVQEFLGHADISTTQIYTHVNKEQIQAAAELLAT